MMMSGIQTKVPPRVNLMYITEHEYSILLLGPDGPYNPQPINTSAVQLNNDLNTIVHKFSEHYHDAWGQRKLENGWQFGEAWSDVNKMHPRLKPYSLLNDYVSDILE